MPSRICTKLPRGQRDRSRQEQLGPMRRASPRMGPRIAHPSWCRKGWRTRGCEGGRGHCMVTRRSEAVTGLPVTSRRIGTADRIRTGDVQLGKSFAADRLVSHGIPHARLASGVVSSEAWERVIYRRFVRKLSESLPAPRAASPKVTRRPAVRTGSNWTSGWKTSDEQLLWPPLSPKPGGAPEKSKREGA